MSQTLTRPAAFGILSRSALRERVDPARRDGWVRVLGSVPILLAMHGTIAAAAEPPPGATSCSGCHPPNAAAEAKVPPLHGLSAEAIVAAMHAFRSGERPSTVMGRIAKGFSDDEVRAIGVWIAARH